MATGLTQLGLPQPVVAPSGVSPSRAPACPPRLVQAAHEFEAQMMKELMKPLTASSSLIGGDEESDSGGGSSGALGEYASESLARALSAGGGLGIANSILRKLAPVAAHSAASPATAPGPAGKAGRS